MSYKPAEVSSRSTDSRPPKKQTVWEVARTLTNEDAGVAVVINKLKLYHPEYSVEIVFLKPQQPSDGSSDGNVAGSRIIMRHGRFRLTRENGVVKPPAHSFTGTITALLRDAEDWIMADAQMREDEIIDYQVQKQAAFNKQNNKSGQGLSKFSDKSKTEHERESGKQAKHAANQAAKAAENQKRKSSGGKGK